MHIVLLITLLIALIVGPQLWIRWVFFRYRAELPDIPGTGGELAEHLIQRFDLEGITVEETAPDRDHFDGSAPAVRLSPRNYKGKSLTAVAVAAHEVGHAIQWHRKESVFKLRSKYIPLAQKLQRAGILMVSLSPLIAVITRNPVGLALPVAGGVIAALCGAATYLIVLPEEWDASFNKALPILIEGDYITAQQAPAARRILRAAAFTYAAGALASLLQVWRWLPLLLRR
ncbi:Zn-dependent protease [Chromatiales bacterium (ex Bugula neritina AB1)]|nr:Zn-dependent protease [Chromatiales bacterium (ex Bugula neritina AB1)]